MVQLSIPSITVRSRFVRLVRWAGACGLCGVWVVVHPVVVGSGSVVGGELGGEGGCVPVGVHGVLLVM